MKESQGLKVEEVERMWKVKVKEVPVVVGVVTPKLKEWLQQKPGL